MKKNEFLRRLEGKLTSLSKEEVHKHLAYYSELIDDMSEDGMSEEEAVNRLGPINKIAENILREQPFPVRVKSKVSSGTGWKILLAVLVILGSPLWLPLLLGVGLIILALYIIIWAVIITMFIIVFALALSCIIVMIAAVAKLFYSFPAAILILGVGICLGGISILAFWFAWFIAKGLIKLSALLGRFLLSIFKGRRA